MMSPGDVAIFRARREARLENAERESKDRDKRWRAVLREVQRVERLAEDHGWKGREK